MRRALTLLLASLAMLCAPSRELLAALRPIPRTELVARADFIGVVLIIETQKTPEADLLPNVDFPRPLQNALALILHTIKGSHPGATLSIDFDNGMICPNPKYDAGESYLVFLNRDDDGTYGTVNFEQGRMLISQEGRIRYWSFDDREGAPLAKVLADIQAMIKGVPRSR